MCYAMAPAEPNKYVFFKRERPKESIELKREREREASWIKVASNVRMPSAEELWAGSIQTGGRDSWRQENLWLVQQIFTREARHRGKGEKRGERGGK